MELAFSNASTGDSFSRDSGSCTPGFSTSAIKIDVFGSTLKPACSAIQAAFLPATAPFSFAFSTPLECAV